MNKSVVIIGAGAAGIAAATRLMAHGFRNVTVLEGGQRIGGRVHTVPYGKCVLDLGAQWCHGETDNVVFQLASGHNLLQPNTLRYDDFLMYQSDGTCLPEATAVALMRIANDILDSDDAEWLRQPRPGASVGSFFTAKFRAALQQPRHRGRYTRELAAQFLEFFHKYENSYEASDSWYEASAGGYVDYWDCPGDLMLNWRDRGYATVFDLLTRRIGGDGGGGVIPVEERVRFGKVVERVRWSPAASGARTRVECADGSAFEADHVICTVSLGVLKERTAAAHGGTSSASSASGGLFDPPLPAAKLAAIGALQLGTVDKIYVHFAQPFWPPEWKGFSLLWHGRDRERLRAEDAWLEAVFGMYRVDYQPNVLCGWISGEAARQMERLPEAQVRAGVVRLLHQFLGRTMAVAEPVAVLRTRWFSDPLFRGSYTFRTVRADEVGTGPEALAAPVWRTAGSGAVGRGDGGAVPVLQFAGEATHEHYYSTVHGAIETGWREASRLIGLYGAGEHKSKL